MRFVIWLSLTCFWCVFMPRNINNLNLKNLNQKLKSLSKGFLGWVDLPYSVISRFCNIKILFYNFLTRISEILMWLNDLIFLRFSSFYFVLIICESEWFWEVLSITLEECKTIYTDGTSDYITKHDFDSVILLQVNF